MATATNQRQPGRGSARTDYVPVLVILAVVALVGGARIAAAGGWNGMLYMRTFMGLFLVVFAMFKLFDLPGFADGFQMYDLLGRRARLYALCYPFVELALGLAYLANAFPVATNIAVIVVMAFGALGVLAALRKGLDIECACLGTTLNVPLSTVALIEDLGMAGMAAVMLTLTT
jgi:small basic protein